MDQWKCCNEQTDFENITELEYETCTRYLKLKTGHQTSREVFNIKNISNIAKL